jgi:hypothetical protein
LNTQTNIDTMEKEAVPYPSKGISVGTLIHESAMRGRHSTVAKFFYSNAQHACIASYLAEDMYGIEAARAMIALYCSAVHVGYASPEIIKNFPCLKVHQDALRLPTFDALGVSISLLRSRSVRHVVKVMEAVECRDVIQTVAPDVRVSPPSDVEIAPMTARQARTALTMRVSELFDADEIGLDVNASLRESTMAGMAFF